MILINSEKLSKIHLKYMQRKDKHKFKNIIYYNIKY